MSLNDIQVILVNDGSSDNSDKIIDKFVSKYENSFICVNHEVPSGGAGKPRNTGMEYVKSKYIIFMDSDDRLEEDFCEILFNQIESEKSNIVCCNFISFSNEEFSYKNTSIINKQKLNPLKYEVNDNNIPFTVWGKIIRFDFFNIIFNQIRKACYGFIIFRFQNKNDIS